MDKLYVARSLANAHVGSRWQKWPLLTSISSISGVMETRHSKYPLLLDQGVFHPLKLSYLVPELAGLLTQFHHSSGAFPARRFCSFKVHPSVFRVQIWRAISFWEFWFKHFCSTHRRHGIQCQQKISGVHTGPPLSADLHLRFGRRSVCLDD